MSESEPRQRRKPFIAAPGWLLFVCLFLPTLRVCGDPMAPLSFPPAYVVHLGALVLGVLAIQRVLAARRAWFSAWFTLWYLTAVGILAAFIGSQSEPAGWVTAIVGLISSFVVTPAFHRQRLTPRAFWIGALLHGIASTAWYLLLATDDNGMWGAGIGLVAAAALALSGGAALVEHLGELRREREKTEPAPLPTARVVER